MCKRLDEFLGEDPKVAERFARRIEVTPFSVRRYRLGQKIPKPDIMIKIVRVTIGAVMPNDFYDIAPAYLSKRYGAWTEDAGMKSEAAE